ncbi:putative membrane protein [Anaerosolibacter carboniphilus]|uniref:Putative membrane protein n=1 Tax=Anaerosolibacter carboniphilus TaxID=1417629 RepID=A0A841KWX6_9FIRM|nr:SHOCT domain-containing protein [Anaerosolibacter carboniphilus]MBB6215432.1 putative membrane protein [Anaerosolibacter carboniphilus]
MVYMMGGGLFGLLIIGLIVYIIVERSSHGHAYREGYPIKNDALDILRERYARGEISDEEYEKKKNLLKN